MPVRRRFIRVLTAMAFLVTSTAAVSGISQATGDPQPAAVLQLRASRNELFMRNAVAQVGARANGSFGSDGQAPTSPGWYARQTRYESDGKLGFISLRSGDWETGVVDGDFFLPGDPFEGWGLQVGSGTTGWNHNYVTAVPGAFQTYSGGATTTDTPFGVWAATSARSSILLSAKYRLDTGTGQTLYMDVTVTNSASSPQDVHYVRMVDADNCIDKSVLKTDERCDTYGYGTDNNIIAQTKLGRSVSAVRSYADDGSNLVLWTTEPDSAALLTYNWSCYDYSDMAAVLAAPLTYGDYDNPGTVGTCEFLNEPGFMIQSDEPIFLVIKKTVPAEASETFTLAYSLSQDAFLSANPLFMLPPQLVRGVQQAGVSWAAPFVEVGTTIGNYVMRYREVGASAWSEVTVGASTLTTTASALTNGSTYEFQIAAVTGTGTRSDFSASSKMKIGELVNLAIPTLPAGPEVGFTIQPEDPDSHWIDFSGEGTTSTYQWLVDYQPLQGATGSTLTIDSTMIGKVISVVVTRTNGYTTLSAGSFAVAAVDRMLIDVTTSAGPLSPEFQPGTLSYTQQLANDVTTVLIRPVSSGSNVNITLNGSPVVSGTEVPVTVTASGLEVYLDVTRSAVTRRYTLRFTRETPQNNLLPPPSDGNSPTTTVPAPAPMPAPAPVLDGGALPTLAPGASQVQQDGVPVPVEVFVDNSTDLVLRGQDFELRLAGDCTLGCTIETTDDGRQVLTLEERGLAKVSGEGFQPGTPVHVWLFSEPTFLGTLTVADDGTFIGSLPLGDSEPGMHTLQVNGTSFDGLPRTANLGVVVRPLQELDSLPMAGTNPTPLWLLTLALLGMGMVLRLPVRNKMRRPPHLRA